MFMAAQPRHTLIQLVSCTFLLGWSRVEGTSCTQSSNGSNTTCNGQVVMTAHIGQTKLHIESKNVFLEHSGKRNLTVCVTNPSNSDYTMTLNVNNTVYYLLENTTCLRHELDLDEYNTTVDVTYTENKEGPPCFCNRTQNIKFKISGVGPEAVILNDVLEVNIGVLVGVAIPMVGVAMAFGFAKVRRMYNERHELDSSEDEELDYEEFEDEEEAKEETGQSSAPDDIETNLGQNETNLIQNETNLSQNETNLQHVLSTMV